MPHFPMAGLPNRPVISSLGPQGLAFELADFIANEGAIASQTWPAANRVLFSPFEVTEPCTVTKMGWYNGGTASGNVDMGIFDMNGTLLKNTGNTAQAGTSALQEVDIADFLLCEGHYWIGIKCESATATMFAAPSTGGPNAPFASYPLTWPVAQASGAAGALAATYTLANRVNAEALGFPLWGLCINGRTLLA